MSLPFLTAKAAPCGNDLLLFVLLLRSQGSNLGPSGYEPDELPLLYYAMRIYKKCQ